MFALPPVWLPFTNGVKASFADGAAMSSNLVLQASNATSPQIVQSACLKWAQQSLPTVAASSGGDLHASLLSLTNILRPFASTCALVDQTLSSSSNSCRQQLLLHFQDQFLTKQFLDMLATWARTDILMEPDYLSDRMEIARLLRELEWTQQAETCFIEACYETIRLHLQEECAMRFTEPNVLQNMLDWCNITVKPWFASLVPTQDSSSSSSTARIEFYLYQQFGLIRSKEIFELVTNFPDSIGGLDDLKQCLLHTQQTKELVQMCKSSLSKRLLHVGTNTNLILLVYVRLIKSLMRIDPRGILLDACSQQIKQYLRSRPETIKCIVQALTNEVAKNSDLAEELGLMDGSNVANVIVNDDDDEDGGDFGGDEQQQQRATLWDAQPIAKRIPQSDWEPDPIEAKTSISQLKSSVDVLANLVRVYGSKELFVTEYRQATAERLLRSAVIDLDAEISRLEMLKLRFGETLLLPVDVMVRDIADSKRANTTIAHANIESLILSRLYWPQFASSNNNDSEFALHPRAKLALAEFAHKYGILKKPRKVHWFPQHGVVELDLTFEDGSVLHCEQLTTMQCNIILHFQDSPEWTLQALATAMGGLDLDVMRKRLQYWISEQVVVETAKNMFEISRQAPSGTAARGEGNDGEFEDDDQEDEEDDDDGVGMGGEEEEEEGYAQEEVDDSHFAFVSTMLTNLGELQLEAIHKNLQLFSAALPMGYDRTEDDLQQLLEACVSKGTLEFSAKTQKFQLPKDLL